jgi:hypothetical protein
MSKSIRALLATAAGITACALAYYATAWLMHTLLLWMSGDPTIFQQVYSDLDGIVFFILRLAVGLYFGFVAFRTGWNYLGRFGIPGLLAPYTEEVGTNPISIKVYVNGEDETGQLSRLEVFSHKVTASKLMAFYWGDESAELLIKGKDGLYLHLLKHGKSPYEVDNASSEPRIAVRVRTRTKLLHSLESVYGEQPTYVVQEGKPVAHFKMALDYVGSQTESLGMLVCNGKKDLMETIFLKQPKAAPVKAPSPDAAATPAAPAAPEHA